MSAQMGPRIAAGQHLRFRRLMLVLCLWTECGLGAAEIKTRQSQRVLQSAAMRARRERRRVRSRRFLPPEYICNVESRLILHSGGGELRTGRRDRSVPRTAVMYPIATTLISKSTKPLDAGGWRRGVARADARS